VTEGCIATVSRTIFRDNIADLNGGAIAATKDTLVMIESSDFAGNEAASVGAALHLDQPLLVKIVHTDFSPLLDGATTVFISGRLGGCAQHPCDPGFACKYDKYSITCTPCEFPLVGMDGLSCVACLAGFGPNVQMTNCTECSGVQFSTIGV
jgi:predicted outer membrane repeat protein